MNGNNTLKLNTATMIKAIDYFLKKEIFKDEVNFKVVSIEIERENLSTYFIVRIESAQPEKSEK